MAGQQQYYEEPADQEYYGQEEQMPAGSTGEDLTALASVPWVAIALAVHVILLVIAWFIIPKAPEPVHVEVIQAQQEQIAEPPPPEQPPEEQVEFPKDEPVQADPTEEPRIVECVQPKPKAPPAPPPLDELRDWQKNSIDILPVFDREKEVFGFRTEWAQRTSQHDDTAFRLSDLCDKNGQLNLDQYKRLRSRLASAILSRVPADGSVIKVCVHLEGKCVNRKNPPKDLMVDWVVAFLQADAIRLLNDSGKLPGNELNTEFEWIYD